MFRTRSREAVLMELWICCCDSCRYDLSFCVSHFVSNVRIRLPHCRTRSIYRLFRAATTRFNSSLGVRCERGRASYVEQRHWNLQRCFQQANQYDLLLRR